MLIRGLVVICYHHAGFRKQHGFGFAQPYRGTELSLLVKLAGTRVSVPIKLLSFHKGRSHNTHNKVPSKFLQSCSILPLSPSRPRPTGGVNLHTSNKQTRLALSGYFIMVAKGCGSNFPTIKTY